MRFKSLKEKGEYYRSLSDYKLIPNSYVIIMLDGRSFSQKIKNKFTKPFDTNFIDMMNKTTEYLCQNIQGAMFGYCQSDEIHIVLADHMSKYRIEDNEGDEKVYSNGAEHGTPFFSYRLCKILSVAASMATSKFNNLMTQYYIKKIGTANYDDVAEFPLYEFDCKAWNIPNLNDTYAWLLYRQFDCIRNSKQQFAQTYFSHSQLEGKSADEQIKLVKEEKGHDWNDLANDVKYGRMVYLKTFKYVSEEYGEYIRSQWVIEPCESFSNPTENEVNLCEILNGRIYFDNIEGKTDTDYDINNDINRIS